MSVLRHGVNVSLVRTEAQGAEFALGARYIDRFGRWFEYAQANGDIDEGATCILTDTITSNEISDVQAAEGNNTASGSTRKKIGIAEATIADNGYGWFFRGFGHTEALVANGISAGAALTTTDTAGVAGAGGDAIAGLYAVDANSSGSTALGTVRADGLLTTN